MRGVSDTTIVANVLTAEELKSYFPRLPTLVAGITADMISDLEITDLLPTRGGALP